MSGVLSNVIIPFVGVEFDSSKASSGPAEIPINFLVIGQLLELFRLIPSSRLLMLMKLDLKPVTVRCFIEWP